MSEIFIKFVFENWSTNFHANKGTDNKSDYQMKRRLICVILLLIWAGCTESGISMPTPDDPPQGGTPETPAAGTLCADGVTDTYALITASGYAYETPDASGSHAAAPVRHITQSTDATLRRPVFAFHIHAAVDDDRGIASVTDRQRNEIKTDAKSPAALVGQEGEEMLFRWKFRLPAGMKTTTRFCHIHQIKGIDNAAGTADVGSPVITFTARTLSNGKQQLQVIYVGPTAAQTGNVYLARADLQELLGEWVEVEERIRFGRAGSYALRIVRIADGKVLADVPAAALDLWRDGTRGMRPKWGIYRSVGPDGSLRGELRDEILLFTDFSIEKIAR